jgi:hypothetical protein
MVPKPCEWFIIDVIYENSPLERGAGLAAGCVRIISKVSNN